MTRFYSNEPLSDTEIISILASDSTYPEKEVASDQLVAKYHDSLLENAQMLYGGDAFYASDTVSRTWITIISNIAYADSNLANWIRQTLYQQFKTDTNR